MADDPRTTFAARWKSLEATHAGEPVRLDATLRPDAMATAPTMAFADVSAVTDASDAWAHPSLPRIHITQHGAIGDGAITALSKGSNADFAVGVVLGEGGMGRVHLARQRSLERDVALKTLRTELADATVAAALLHEARITGGLEHPGIVPVHALGVDERGYPLIVMKRIDGISWRDLLHRDDATTWSRVMPDGGDRLEFHLDVLGAVCNALEFAHTRGVVHRDVKPENVMIGFFGEVYLVDWGIAIRTRDANGATGPAGTPAYMAPEMLSNGVGAIDARTDVYLLGATLHEVLTGTVRHAGASIGIVLEHVYLSEPAVYGADVPDELAQLANRATSRDPAMRPATALAFRQALLEYRGHRGSVVLTETALRRRADLDALLAASTSDATAIARIANESRFAFAQALAQWPENHAARAGLESLRETMACFELSRRNAASARELLDEMTAAPAALRAELDVLERTITEEREKAKQLDALAHDLDERVGSRARIRLLLALGAIGVAISIAVLRTPDREITTSFLLVPGAVVLGATLFVSVVFRKMLTLSVTV